MAKLYVVDVPVDRPEDLTYRALRVLGQMSLLVIPGGDGTLRPTMQALVTHYGLQTPVRELPAQDARAAVQAVLAALSQGDVAWVWDGAVGAHGSAWRVLRALCERGVDLVSVPGPSSELTALAISGLPTARFVLLGPLPWGAEARRATLHGAMDEHSTVVCTVPAGSLAAALDDCLLLLGDRQVAIWRVGGMWRGRFSRAPVPPEQAAVVLVIAGAAPEETWSEEKVREQVRARLAEGSSPRDVAQDIAGRSGWSKRKVYAMAARLRSARAKVPGCR